MLIINNNNIESSHLGPSLQDFFRLVLLFELYLLKGQPVIDSGSLDVAERRHKLTGRLCLMNVNNSRP